MKIWLRQLTVIVFCAGLGAFAYQGQRPLDRPDTDVKLPNGKSQRDEILKAEHEANLKDSAELVRLTEELRIDIEKNDRYVLSLATVRKTDEIEKLVKRIRSRMRRN